jgi:hypothetical protein
MGYRGLPWGNHKDALPIFDNLTAIYELGQIQNARLTKDL